MTRQFTPYLAGAGILLFQIGMICHARCHPMRYCCWAPFDALNHYEISAEWTGRAVENKEFHERYGLRKRGFNQRSIQHVKDILIQVEQSQEAARQWELSMRYTTNSAHPRQWTWIRGTERDFPDEGKTSQEPLRARR